MSDQPLTCCGNLWKFHRILFFHLSPKLPVRVALSGSGAYKSCRNLSLVGGTTETMLGMLCLLFGVSGGAFSSPPVGSNCFLMVSQLGAPLLDCFLSDRYSMLFLPPPPLQCPPPPHANTHSLFLEKLFVCVCVRCFHLKEKQLSEKSFRSFQTKFRNLGGGKTAL